MKKKKKSVGQIVLHVIFILLSLCYIIPFVLIISISFTSGDAISSTGFSLIPKEFSTAAYQMIFQNPLRIINAYKTTIISTVAATAGSLVVMAMFAYPLSRPNFKMKNVLTFILFFTTLFSGGLVPSYLINTKLLHLNDTIWIYIFPCLMNAWNVIVIRTYFKNLPADLIEAAKIDGAGELRICFGIVIPLSTPVLASVGFLTFITRWNDWMTSKIYVRKQSLYTLQYLLKQILDDAEFMKNLVREGSALANEISFPTESFRFAMAIVAAGPIMFIFPFFQKYFAEGLTLGSVKG